MNSSTNNSDTRTAAEQGQVVASAAEVYEQLFVPALFGQFAPIAVTRSGVRYGDRFLDVACGTGIAARTALTVVGTGGRVVGIDVNPAMLTVAASLNDAVEWVEAPAESLPLESGSFDAAVCQFGLMFFADPVTALGEMARVVKPGGPVVVSTWCDVSTNPGYEALVQLLDDEFGTAAADALRAPFSIGTEESLTALVDRAFEACDVWTEPGIARFPSLKAWLQADIRGWTLADAIDDGGFETLLGAARTCLADFVDLSGAVSFDAPAVMAIGAGTG